MPDAQAEMAFRAVGPLAPLQRIALWCAGLAGWRRYGMAALLGALAAAALPPVDLTPVLVVSFTGLIWLADGTASRRGALALGWSFGFGFFVAGLYWIAAALFVDIARFWWMVPFAVAGLPAGLAIFTGSGAARGLRGVRAAAARRQRAHPGLRRGLERGGMAARPCADRLSLEPHRLCLGRRLPRRARRAADPPRCSASTG